MCSFFSIADKLPLKAADAIVIVCFLMSVIRQQAQLAARSQSKEDMWGGFYISFCRAGWVWALAVGLDLHVK